MDCGETEHRWRQTPLCITTHGDTPEAHGHHKGVAVQVCLDCGILRVPAHAIPKVATP